MPATTMPQNLMMFGALYEIGECGNFKTYRQRFTLARHCGPVIAQRNVCRLCERPSEIHHDERSWLHADGRAALCYRSGLSFYRWHGIDMPAGLMLKDPGSITLDDIIEQPTMMHRRVLIERMGVDRFVRRHAIRVSADECGCLWAASFRTSRPEWAAVEVVNGTPEHDGSFRHYFLQVPPEMETAREAVGWTFGLPVKDYNVALRT